MSSRVRVDIDTGKALAYGVRVARQATHRAAVQTGWRARGNLIAAGRIRTGALLDSIDVKPGYTPTAYHVGSGLDYAIYQEEGIGPVVPIRAKALRFKPKGSNVYVFAQRTRGFAGAHYMRDALRSLSMRDFLP